MKKLTHSLLFIILIYIPLTSQEDCYLNNTAFIQTFQDIQYKNDNIGSWTYNIIDLYEDEATYNSLIFAQSVWVAGVTDSGTIKSACNKYASLNQGYDFYPGPLDDTGKTYLDQCTFWDREFTVNKKQMQIAYSNLYTTNGTLRSNIDCSKIPKPILQWPGMGNTNLAPFAPDHTMADFYDRNADGIYNPCDGDLPVLTTNGTTPNLPIEVLNSFPDFLTYSVKNDAGGTHRLTAGEPMGIELHNYWWSIKTNQESPTVSFQKHKVVNRGSDTYEKLYLGIWADFDIGCSTDDYAGTFKEKDMVFIYNADAIDGDSIGYCSGAIGNFNDHPPMVGMSILKGFNNIDSFGNVYDTKLVGSSFTVECIPFTSDPYYCDPSYDIHFLNLLRGLNIFGDPIGLYADNTTYMFEGNPNDTLSNSMCKHNLSKVDAKGIFSTGGGPLAIGSSEEMVFAQYATFDVKSPCPDIAPLIDIADEVKELHDSNWKNIKDIDPPTMSFTRNRNTISFELTNDINSNNFYEKYEEFIINSPSTEDKYKFKFEGYQVYQVKTPNLNPFFLNNDNYSRIVYQTDIENDVKNIVNYKTSFDQNNNKTYIPVEKVNATNKGISTSFDLSWDYLKNKPIERDGEYYYIAVAYAHNEYENFNPTTDQGQQFSYLESKKLNPVIVPTAKDNEPLAPQITRIHGIGTSNNLRITNKSLNEIIQVTNNGRITYEVNHGPFDVIVLDESKVKKDAIYQVKIIGVFDNQSAVCAYDLDNTYVSVVDIASGITYENLEPVGASGTFVIDELGILIEISDVHEPGDKEQMNNGILNQTLTYADENGPKWLDVITSNHPALNGVNDIDVSYKSNLDNFESFALENYQNNPKQYFAPVALNNNNYHVNTESVKAISPSLNSLCNFALRNRSILLEHLNNVDIVFTSDKNLWSKCIVVETANETYLESEVKDNINVKMLLVKSNKPSVDKDGFPTGTDNGYSWFPGYAIDVETGERLNIFFGENTGLSNPLAPMIDNSICDDMLFNPSDEIYNNQDPSLNPLLKAVFGGQHFIYVTRQQYDECAELYASLSSLNPNSYKDMTALTWTVMPALTNGASLLPISNGLIPNDLKVSLRVSNKFSKQKDAINLANIRMCNTLPEEPLYEFELNVNTNITSNPTSENRSIPWTIQSNVNYFKVNNGLENIEVSLINLSGTILGKWDIMPNQMLEISDTKLPNTNSLFLVKIKSKISKTTKTYRLVVVK